MTASYLFLAAVRVFEQLLQLTSVVFKEVGRDSTGVPMASV